MATNSSNPAGSDYGQESASIIHPSIAVKLSRRASALVCSFCDEATVKNRSMVAYHGIFLWGRK
jgi:hypothetical protein